MPQPLLSDIGHLLRNCVAQISDTIIVTETSPLEKPGPRIVFVNEAIERMTGYTQEELIGKSPRIFQGPETDRQALLRIREALQAKKPWQEEIVNYTRDGTPFWLEMRVMHVPAQSVEDRAYFVAIGRDVSKRREQQHRLQKSEQQLRRINHTLESVREEERTRIARDLHDDLGQTLTAMKLELELLLEAETSPTPLQQTKLQRLIGIADGAVDQIRDIASNLRPSLLDHAGFVDAVRWYVQEANQRLAAHVVFETGLGCEMPLADDTGIGLYRMLQEAVTNISRHAKAHNVCIRYAAPNNRPCLEVRDDGIGFDPVSAELAGAVGLLGLRERAEQLGGQLMIHSAPGCGCTIIIELPEQHEKDQNYHR